MNALIERYGWAVTADESRQAEMAAHAIVENVRAHLRGDKSREEFDATARMLWNIVARGEMCTIGSNCDKRQMLVKQYIKEQS